MPQLNSFGAASTLAVGGSQYKYYALEALAKRGANIARIPYSIKILLENLLRTENGATVKASDIEYVSAWKIGAPAKEINFSPARVLLQDFTGVPCVVDLAAMRDALRAMGADPKRSGALRIPALGPKSVSGFSRGPARHRHRAPGESGISRARGLHRS
jgi:aconitate hydratase